MKNVKEGCNSNLSLNEISAFLESKHEFQFSNVANDVTVRGTPQSSSVSLTTPPFLLPRIYNVFQMQQQLLTFYHQMALLSPATFPYIKPTQPHANVEDTTSGEIDLSYKKELYNTTAECSRPQKKKKKK